MSDEQFIIGDNGGDMGIWVARPGGAASAKTSNLLLTSQRDMLRVMMSGKVQSTGVFQNQGPGQPPYFHNIQINYPEPLDYIPLALFGRSVEGEPFQFPPDLVNCFPSVQGAYYRIYNGRIVIRHDYLLSQTFTFFPTMRWHYVIFYNKIFDKLAA